MAAQEDRTPAAQSKPAGGMETPVAMPETKPVLLNA